MNYFDFFLLINYILSNLNILSTIITIATLYLKYYQIHASSFFITILIYTKIKKKTTAA